MLLDGVIWGLYQWLLVLRWKVGWPLFCVFELLWCFLSSQQHPHTSSQHCFLEKDSGPCEDQCCVQILTVCRVWSVLVLRRVRWSIRSTGQGQTDTGWSGSDNSIVECFHCKRKHSFCVTNYPQPCNMRIICYDVWKSVYLWLCVCVCVSLSLSVFPCASLSLSLSLYPLSPCAFLSFSLSLSLSLSLSVGTRHCLSRRLSQFTPSCWDWAENHLQLLQYCWACQEFHSECFTGRGWGENYTVFTNYQYMGVMDVMLYS